MIKGSVLRDSMISGANSIANQRSQIDELNVFPVPDGCNIAPGTALPSKAVSGNSENFG